MTDTPLIEDPSEVTKHEAVVIQARGLARWYGQVIGLTDLSVDIPSGITGLLGPNGAGKSTFMRLLTGQIHPSAGSVWLLGKQPAWQPEVFQDVGFCSEDDALYEDMTAREMVTFLARCSGFEGDESRERAASALERCGMGHALDKACSTFSKGMRQRTRIAAALVHDPKLLLLDEPMTGLDPVGRRDVVNIIKQFANSGGSVLFSSHILHEVEAVAEHVAIMNKGMLLAEGTLEEIQNDLSDYAFSLKIRCDQPRKLARAIVERGHVIGVSFEGPDGITISSESAKALSEEVPPIALEEGIDLMELSCPNESLENLFQRLMK